VRHWLTDVVAASAPGGARSVASDHVSGAVGAAEGATGGARWALGRHSVGAAGGANDADRWTLVGCCWAALLALLGARYALDGFVGDHVAMWRSGSGLALAGAALRDPLL